jgi:hypothetical protein
MCLLTPIGAKIDLSVLEENDLIKVLFQKILELYFKLKKIQF